MLHHLQTLAPDDITSTGWQQRATEVDVSQTCCDCGFLSIRFVHGKDRETAGSLMTFFLILGLALGASFSFLLGKLV